MNWPTFIVTLLIAAAVLAIVIRGIRNKKKGKSSCSCGCSCGGCPMSGQCHGETVLDSDDPNTTI